MLGWENNMKNNCCYGKCSCDNYEIPMIISNNDNNQCCESKRETRQEMLEQIKCYMFAITDISLYLDTHPDDQKALCLHREYCKVCKELKDNYQRMFGPLTIYYPCNKWRWLEEPWPWEGEC